MALSILAYTVDQHLSAIYKTAQSPLYIKRDKIKSIYLR